MNVRICAVSCAAFAAAAHAQPTISIIAQTGQQVPGEGPGIVFARTFNPSPGTATTAFSDTAIDAAGNITFKALYPTPQANINAIIRNSGSTLAPLWYGVQPDPARGNAPATWWDVRLFSDGAPGGLITVGPTNSSSRGYARANPFIVAAFTGEPAGPTAGDTWYFDAVDTSPGAPNFSFNRAGQGVFAHQVRTPALASKFVAGFIDPSGAASEILRQDSLPPNVPAGQTAFTILTPQRPAIGPDGTIAIASTMTGTSQPWLFVGTSTNLFPVLNSFTDITGMPANTHLSSTTYSGPVFWPSASVAPDGQVAAIVQVSGPSAPLQGALISGNSAGVQVVLHDKDTVPGLAPGIVVRLGNTGANQVLTARGGVIAFDSFVATPAATNLMSHAIIAGTPGNFRVIAQTGDPLPGAPGVTFFAAGLAGITAFQDVLVDALLSGTGVNSTNRSALVAFTPDLGPVVLLRTGNPLTLGPGDIRIVAGFSDGGGDVHIARNSQINDSRQIAIVVAFTDNSEAVLRLTLSAPACRADLDRSGTLSVQDVFEFLNAWFAGEPRADFNNSGALETQDIFDFLNAWFAGCP